MKFINLNRASKDPSYLNIVLNLGCGPNFIKNRPDQFEEMIKEQGLEFWFRFWLTFSLQYNLKEYEEFEKEVPGWITSICQIIHCNFVEVSTKEAARFCWNSILKERDYSQIFLLSPSSSKSQPKRKMFFTKNQQFADLTSEYIQTTFACALGEVFYKWLNADKKIDNISRKYWCVPLQYLDPEFKPGALEKFIVNKWGINLAKFFGVKIDRLPWVRQLLRYDKDILKRINDPTVGKQNELIVEVYETSETRLDDLKNKIKDIKKEIQAIDEVRNEECVNRKHLRRPSKSGQELNKKFYSRNVPCRSEIYLKSNNEKKNDKSVSKELNLNTASTVLQYTSCTSFRSEKNRNQKTKKSDQNVCSAFQFGYKIDFV